MSQIQNIEKDIANILKDNCTYSPQAQALVIHGAVEKLIEYFLSTGRKTGWVTDRNPTEEGWYHTKGDELALYWHQDKQKWANGRLKVTAWLDESLLDQQPAQFSQVDENDEELYQKILSIIYDNVIAEYDSIMSAKENKHVSRILGMQDAAEKISSLFNPTQNYKP